MTDHAALIAKLEEAAQSEDRYYDRNTAAVIREAITVLQAPSVGIGHWTPDEIANLNDEAWRKAHPQ